MGCSERVRYRCPVTLWERLHKHHLEVHPTVVVTMATLKHLLMRKFILWVTDVRCYSCRPLRATNCCNKNVATSISSTSPVCMLVVAELHPATQLSCSPSLSPSVTRKVAMRGFHVETVEYKNITFTIWDVGGQDKDTPKRRSRGGAELGDETNKKGTTRGGRAGVKLGLVVDWLWMMTDWLAGYLSVC